MTKTHNKNPRGGNAGVLPRVRPWGRFQSPQQYTGSLNEIKGRSPTNTGSPHGVLVVAPDEAIIGLRNECGSDIWEVDTPAGTLKCSTKGLTRFKRFRNRCAYRLGIAFSTRPTQAEWVDILNDAIRRFLDGQIEPARFDAMGEPE